MNVAQLWLLSLSKQMPIKSLWTTPAFGQPENEAFPPSTFRVYDVNDYLLSGSNRSRRVTAYVVYHQSDPLLLPPESNDEPKSKLEDEDESEPLDQLEDDEESESELELQNDELGVDSTTGDGT